MAEAKFYSKEKIDELLAESSSGIPSIIIAMSQFSDETHFTLTEEQARTIVENNVISITIQHHWLPGYESYEKYDGAYSKSDDNPYPSSTYEDIIALTRIIAKEDISEGFFVGRIKITATKLRDEYVYTSFSGEFDYGESGASSTGTTYEEVSALPEEGQEGIVYLLPDEGGQGGGNGKSLYTFVMTLHYDDGDTKFAITSRRDEKAYADMFSQFMGQSASTLPEVESLLNMSIGAGMLDLDTLCHGLGVLFAGDIAISNEVPVQTEARVSLSHLNRSIWAKIVSINENRHIVNYYAGYEIGVSSHEGVSDIGAFSSLLETDIEMPNSISLSIETAVGGGSGGGGSAEAPKRYTLHIGVGSGLSGVHFKDIKEDSIAIWKENVVEAVEGMSGMTGLTYETAVSIIEQMWPSMDEETRIGLLSKANEFAGQILCPCYWYDDTESGTSVTFLLEFMGQSIYMIVPEYAPGDDYSSLTPAPVNLTKYMSQIDSITIEITEA